MSPSGGAAAPPQRSPKKYVVGRLADIPPGQRLIVRVRGRSYGIFNLDGSLHALLNRCPHQGGELCKGGVQTLIAGDAPGEVRFDTSRWMIQCPWHGWEYDIKTGQSYTEPDRSRVRSFPVEVEEGGELAHHVAAGAADTSSSEYDPIVPGGVHGTVVSQRVEGPFKAESVEVSVEDDYVVLHLAR